MPALRKYKEIVIILSVILIIIIIILISFLSSVPFIFKDYKTETSENLQNIATGIQIQTEPVFEKSEDEFPADFSEPAEYTEPPDPDTQETNAEPAATIDHGPPMKAKRQYQGSFDALRAKYNNNKDIVGIIKIPGTVVYYPVAHYIDNSFYLDRNLYRQYSAAGSIMMDYENDVERHDPNTILYGHQMSVTSGTMFHTLRYYMDEEYYKNHKYIIFNTIYEDNVWEVFAFFKTHTSFNYITVFFKSERSFLNLAAEMKKRSVYDTGIEIEAGDRILTLSTCTNIASEPDTRYVLVARMIKNKADIPEDIAEQMANAVAGYK